MDETKEIKINIPEGYEIDKEHSTFECIKFKKKAKKINVWKDITYVTGFTLIIAMLLLIIQVNHVNLIKMYISQKDIQKQLLHWLKSPN